MQFVELARKRYSVRSYKPDPVEDDKLQQVLEAACLAPTAANRQAFRLIVVHTKGKEGELQRIYNRPWFVQAPLLICACVVPNETWVRRDAKNYGEVDIGIVFDHLVMAATDLGLGTCWVAGFDLAAAREVMSVPEQVTPMLFTPLGYPADEPKPKKRKPVAELVNYERC